MSIDDIKADIRSFTKAPHTNHLLLLADSLIKDDGLWNQQLGPYSASHGVKHIEHVVRHVVSLHKTLPEEARLNDRYRAILLTAAMIHDVGMTDMRSVGSSGASAHSVRLAHSSRDVIEAKVHDLLLHMGFSEVDAQEAISIACAHSADKVKTVENKLADAQKDKPNKAHPQIAKAIRLLAFADFLDLGADRLVPGAGKQLWSDEQWAHLRKHQVLATPLIEGGVFILALASGQAGNTTTQTMSREADGEGPSFTDILCVLHSAREDLETHLRHINELAHTDWYLKPLDEEYFGKVVPLSTTSGLFLRELEAARTNQNPGESIEIDMMGHSLYQRFYSDKGQLNTQLKQLLRAGNTTMRVLLLDPNCENQQACEVFDGQLKSPLTESNRSILRLLDSDGEKADSGDIGKSLESIDKDWKVRVVVQGLSILEVRSTRRLMYASLVRFGDRMIVTPYIAQGLFNQSGGILLTEKSPVFKAYVAEFESLWNHRWETRVMRHIAESPKGNPINRLLRHEPSRGVPGFNYESWLLGDKDKLRRICKHEIVPPSEVEIQPTTACGLKCRHCIGTHLYPAHTDCSLGHKDIRWLDSVLDWEVSDQKVKRVRISGLHGDPLTGGACDFTRIAIKRIKERGREVVLFTNGIGLSNIDVLDDVLSSDYLHISLDAGSSKTFNSTKGVDLFDTVIENARLAKAHAIRGNKPIKVGFGFVVTQQNHTEAGQAIDLARRQNVDFVRFRRDIHRPDALGWRAWCTAKEEIRKKCQATPQGSLPEIYVMDLPKRHWSSIPDKCWMQYCCVTIGPDACVYPCDHLSGMTSNSFGCLENTSFEQIMRNARQSGALTRVGPDCWQCPPFNSRGNRLLEEMNVLFKSHGWEQVDNWLEEALRVPAQQ